MTGADFAMGREGYEEFCEPTAPPKADKMTMGSSVQWYSVEGNASSTFPAFKYNELKALMHKGVGRYDAENIQNYNQGGTLGPKQINP